MIRYYISDLIGNGSDEDSFRSLAGEYSLHVSGNVPVSLSTGMPTQDWMLVTVYDLDQSALVSVVGVDPLPTCPLETLMTDMTAADMAMIDTAMAAHNIVKPHMALALTYGDALAVIGEIKHTAVTTPPSLEM